MGKIGRFWGVIEKFLSVFMLVYKLQLVIFRQMAYTILLYVSIIRIRENSRRFDIYGQAWHSDFD